MDLERERHEFRRMAIIAKVERSESLINQYRGGIDLYRDRLDVFHDLLGRISDRLGEPEPEEP